MKLLNQIVGWGGDFSFLYSVYRRESVFLWDALGFHCLLEFVLLGTYLVALSGVCYMFPSRPKSLPSIINPPSISFSIPPPASIDAFTVQKGERLLGSWEGMQDLLV